MRRLIELGGDWGDIWLDGCDLCGHLWLQEGAKESFRCPHRECRTTAWNGKSKRLGRRDKTQIQASQEKESKQRPILDGSLRDGKEGHSGLCACMSCLRAMGMPQESTPASRLKAKLGIGGLRLWQGDRRGGPRVKRTQGGAVGETSGGNKVE